MRILVFSTQHMPTGGIESHLQEFCYHMVRSGVEVDLVVTNSSMSGETENFFQQICTRIFLGGNGRSFLRFFWLLFVGIKLCTKRYDAFYTNGQGESINLFSKLLPRRGRWVHHHHTAGDAKDQSSWGKNYRKALQAATLVIACSNRNAREMEDSLKRKVHNIPCFSREITAGGREIETGVHTMRTSLRFGYYGRLIREKGIDLLCQLSQDSDLKEVEFHLWGEGEAYPLSFFKEYEKVTYHGTFRGTEELTSVIESLDAFLLLSTHPEGLPISLLEVMSAGIPWLATDQGGIPDIALDASSTRIISVNSSYADVKKAVLSLAADIKAGRISYAIQRNLYLKKFSSSALISQWQEILGLGRN